MRLFSISKKKTSVQFIRLYFLLIKHHHVPVLVVKYFVSAVCLKYLKCVNIERNKICTHGIRIHYT